MRTRINMLELNDNNVSQLIFENFKTDKKIRLIMHGDIYQYESEFYINGIFKEEDDAENEEKDEDDKYHISYLPLKTLAAFPLGAIFLNKQITGENILKKIIDVKINLKMKRTGFSKISDIEKLKNVFGKIPDKISGYTGQRKQIMNQYVAVYKDQLSGKILYIPHYEIARWFYLRSSSLTRQVLAVNLEGLYYEAKYLDPKKSIAELYMKHGSSNGDAAEVFRFAKDKFANAMFESFGINLSASKFSRKDTKYDCRSRLQVNFPVYGNINLKIKGFSIDSKSIFVYQFIEEDSRYPFDELTVYRYGPNKKKEKEAIVTKKKPNIKEIDNIVQNETPSSDYKNVTTKNNVFMNEIRKDLENKKIKHPPLLDPSEVNDSIAEYTIQVSGVDIELSVSDASHDGDERFIHTSLVQETITEDDHFVERENNLVAFRRMIFALVDVDRQSDMPTQLGVNILMHANLPRKPKDYKGRAKWEKSKLNNGKPRQYMVAQVSIKNYEFYLIEIEKNDKEDAISIQVVYRKNQALHQSVLHKIVRDFVRFNGRWKIADSLDKFSLNHIGTDSDIADRLYKKLKKIIAA